jgi:hypothetical protein
MGEGPARHGDLASHLGGLSDKDFVDQPDQAGKGRLFRF